MKRGLIFPKKSMQNAWTAQGLPWIYGRLAPYLELLIDFSDATGGMVRDKSNNGFDFTIYPGDSSGTNDSIQEMWNNAKPGGINFDGVNDYIDIPVASTTNWAAWFDIGKAATINFWVKDNAYNSYGTLLNYWDYDVSGTSGTQHYLLLRHVSTTKAWQVGMSNGTYSNRFFVDTATTNIPASGIPYMITITYDGGLTPSSVGIMINGVSQSLTTTVSGTLANNSIYDNAGRISVGCTERLGNLPGTPVQASFYSGSVYLMAGFSKVLTQAEAAALYNFEKQFVR